MELSGVAAESGWDAVKGGVAALGSAGTSLFWAIT
jgi:hypothetical protein